MINLDKVDYGFFPYAGAQGMVMFHYHFNIDKVKSEDETKSVQDIFASLSEKVEKLDKKEEFNDSLLGKVYTVFTFNNIDLLFSEENKVIWNSFYANMSKMSFDLQKADAGGLSSKMNAWPVALYTKPTYYTGDEEFYQYFNLIFCELPVSKDDKEYSPFALAEILQNPFTHIFSECKSLDDLEIFKKNWIENPDLSVPYSRLNILLKNDSSEELFNEIKNLGLRVCIPLPEKISLNLR